MSDDHAYQAISSYDDRLIQTPNIDRLAEEGIKFTNACVTNSICAPSRATILTGKFSHLNGKIDNHSPFDTSQVTFPQLFKKAGYQTAMFGKLHFGNNPKGVDDFLILPGQGDYINPKFLGKEKLIKIKEDGITKKLMGVKIDIDEISVTGSLDLTDDNNNIIGELRSACYSPHFKKVIGIAMMQKKYWNPEQNIKVVVNGHNCVGKVCDLPFI